MIKLKLCDRNVNLIKSWKKYFEHDPSIDIIHGSIFEVECDALVSPANSFGFMDGGLDLSISYFFGWHVQARLQEIIKKKYHGELLVGLAEIVKTDNEKIPYVISAPTMRVPLILKASVNAYLATRAVLILVKYGIFKDGSPISEKVNTVVFPGMGTGVGRLTYDICALQMKTAIDDIYYEKYDFPITLSEAQINHKYLSKF